MSRSIKKSPASGIACPDSEKDWKVESNRRYRRRIKESIRNNEDPPLMREITDVWDAPKDGRQWHGEKTLKGGLTSYRGEWIPPYKLFGK